MSETQTLQTIQTLPQVWRSAGCGVQVPADSMRGFSELHQQPNGDRGENGVIFAI